jgi:CHAT domain-containing protein
MKISAISFNGTERKNLDKSQYSDENLTLENYYEIEQIVRGKEKPQRIESKKDQVLEFEFEDGTSWISSLDRIEDIFPELMTTAKRSVNDEVEIPLEITTDSADRSIIGKILLKAIKVFSKKATAREVKRLALNLENKQLDEKIGLFRVNRDFQLSADIPAVGVKPFLLLIHGTASSVAGSFGNADDSDFMRYIRETYDERIIAFQHRTLTENPLQNVKDLLDALPDKCILHLVTTSRGGLVGEVLSRFCNSQGAKGGFNNTELAILKRDYSGKYFQELEKLIGDINQILTRKNIVIEKFVRIACPAGGTTLASKRLDFVLNITLNLLGLAIGIAASPLYNAFRSLTAAVIGSKNEPEILPGLEVQRPDSPFIKALNCPTDIDNPDGKIMIANSLVVIAGNSKPALKISALWIIASKLFFLRKNDLVVDTNTMALGTRRTGKVLQFFYEDSNLNHFKYFENRETNQAILLALKSDWGTSLPGFTEQPLSVSVAADRNIKFRPDGGEVMFEQVSGTKPIVLLLPSIMGSNLKQEEKLLWIKYAKIILGGLADLKPENNLTPASLVSTAYKKLAEELKEEYDVVTFPFDWRMSLEHSAKLLNDKVKELLSLNQPVKLIGHSMGGVLIRDFMVLYKETWQKLNNTEGFRLIFLGAPLGGSFRIPAVLFGMDRLIEKLSLIDLVHKKTELIQVFSQFQGLLGLLPFDGKYDFSNQETWEEMRNGADNKNWPIPDNKNLNWFKSYRDKMKDALVEEDFKNAVYVAGKDRATPCEFRIDKKSTGDELVFLSTAEGDQSVTWESGIPDVMKNRKNAVYYVNVTHGELACHPIMFKGIKEILSSGATRFFSDKQPLVRGEEKLFKAPDFRDFDLSEAGIDFSVLGIGGETEPEVEQPPIGVSISHGDLYYSRFPVLAGHFEGDGILYAEKAIDKYLGGTLNYHHRLGIYPGTTGSSNVFLSRHSGFNGAIIIGLGKPENLTATALMKSVEQGASNYLLHINDHFKKLYQSKPDNKPVGISSLIVGSGYGGLTIENSMKAIIQGVYNANKKVAKLEFENPQLIHHIEFVELYEDNAVSALYSLGRIDKQESRSFKIIIEEKKIQILLGSKKRIPNEISSGWWNRITVTEDYDNEEKTIKCLKFSASTGRAYEKESKLPTTPVIIEGTIQEMSTSNRWSPQKAKSMFELLIPNEFKEQLKRHGNINWILDYYTAQFPWEMLQDEIADSSPLCIASGMIRQLATENYRQVIKAAPANNALVIADPDLKGFASQLPGALKEGQLVSEILTEQGLTTTSSFNGTSSEIIEKMFCNDYRIIHLSGHGFFHQDASKGSGMVIGENMYLSTREIRQMSTVPELVFVNCCHIGKVDDTAEEFYRKRYRLAANIGTQLIENGVKCVIAAGWAVNDSAALEFARVFYNLMFSGYTFGHSVKEARKVIFEKFRYSNTWGAYQCYGDPFFRFEHKKTAHKQDESEYLISQEAEVDLANLFNELDIGEKSTDEYLEILDTISEKIDRAKIRTPKITELEALVLFEIRDYDNACEKFGSLLNNEEASFSYSVAEKYNNARAKKIVRYFNEFLDKKNDELNSIETQIKNLKSTQKKKTGGKSAAKKSEELIKLEDEMNKIRQEIEKEREDSLKEIKEVISDLTDLIKLSPTSQRFNILGSTYKRAAFLSKVNKQENYKNAAYYYHKGFVNSDNWYSLTNWLSLESSLVMSGIHTWGAIEKAEDETGYKIPSLKEAIGMLETTAASLCKINERMSYWDMLAGINIGLCKYIVQFTENEDKKEVENIFKDISHLWKQAGSKGKRFAEIEHLELLIDALSAGKNKKIKALAAKLEQLKNDLANLL